MVCGATERGNSRNGNALARLCGRDPKASTLLSECSLICFRMVRIRAAVKTIDAVSYKSALIPDAQVIVIAIS